MSRAWHRVFHPLCGADPLTLLRLVARHGPPEGGGWARYGVALATALARVPFMLADRAVAAAWPADAPPPVFIVGFPRSGTTHLHNLLAASGAFATAPPVLAAMPWEPVTLAPVARRFVDPFLPETRLIDGMAMGPDTPTEDEVGLANLSPESYFHAVYFPRHLARDYRAGLAAAMTPARERAVGRYVAALARAARGRPLLLKNPAYTSNVARLLELFPGSRAVHIHRDPREVFASAVRALRRTLGELALQRWDEAEVEAAVLGAYPEVMRAYRAQAARVGPGRLVEVGYAEVVADPVGAVGRLRRALGLPEGDPAALGRHLRSVAGFRPEGARLSEAELRRLRRLWPEEMARGVSAAGGG